MLGNPVRSCIFCSEQLWPESNSEPFADVILRFQFSFKPMIRWGFIIITNFSSVLHLLTKISWNSSEVLWTRQLERRSPVTQKQPSSVNCTPPIMFNVHKSISPPWRLPLVFLGQTWEHSVVELTVILKSYFVHLYCNYSTVLDSHL